MRKANQTSLVGDEFFSDPIVEWRVAGRLKCITVAALKAD